LFSEIYNIGVFIGSKLKREVELKSTALMKNVYANFLSTNILPAYTWSKLKEPIIF
jgi:hypothetical protein